MSSPARYCGILGSPKGLLSSLGGSDPLLTPNLGALKGELRRGAVGVGKSFLSLISESDSDEALGGAWIGATGLGSAPA